MDQARAIYVMPPAVEELLIEMELRGGGGGGGGGAELS